MDHIVFEAGNPMSNRRSETRGKIFKGAHIRFNKGYSAYEAIVRDVSKQGARLRFGDVIDLPAEFEIRVGTGGNYHNAHVAWRHGMEIGVAFSS